MSAVSRAQRIGQLEAELADLREQQRLELAAAIVMVIGVNCCFSARELWRHQQAAPELRTAFEDAGITSARQLGKRLRQLAVTGADRVPVNSGLERVGVDHDGAIWICRL